MGADHGVADRAHILVLPARSMARRRGVDRIAPRDEQAEQPRRCGAGGGEPGLRRRLVGKACALDGRQLREMRSGHSDQQQRHAQAQNQEFGSNLPSALQLVQQAAKRGEQRD
jgi:hypothetical protein